MQTRRHTGMTLFTIRRRAGGTIGRYLLSLAVRPFLGTLLIVLPALLMERLLRLFDLVANDNVPALSVVRMLADLLPHYLGLALPAALFVGVYAVVARLSAENELDALQSIGISLGRISRPFLLIGVVATICGVGLYGYVQPYARYAYRAALQAATEGTWDATVVPGELIHVSKALTVTADRADRLGGRVHHLFIYQRRGNGMEAVTTARDGRVVLSADGTQLLLTLRDAVQIDTPVGQQPGTLTTPQTSIVRPFALTLARFRARGTDEREMTPGELWTAMRHPSPTLPRRRLQAELHSRIVRALSLALIPLLAVPLGLAGKRVRRQHGMVVGVVVLVLYYHAIQLAQSFGTAGLGDARPAIWGLTALFAAVCLAGFRWAGRHTSESPVETLISLLDRTWSIGVLRGRHPIARTEPSS